MTSIATSQKSHETETLEPVAGPHPWSNSAPKAVLKSTLAGREEAAWQAWCKHLKQRKNPRDVQTLLKARQTPFGWGVCSASERKLIAKVKIKSAPPAAQDPVALGLYWLAVVQQLPVAASDLSAADWWAKLHAAIQTVTEANQAELDITTVGGQLLRGELPLTLAYLFPEVAACSQLLSPARSVLSAGVEELLDGEGVMHAKEWHNLRLFLACWTRCCALGKYLPDNCWDAAAAEQFPLLVRETLRHARPDGQSFFTSQNSAENSTRDEELLAAALELANDAGLRRIAKQLQQTSSPGIKTEIQRLGHPAVTSEWAQSALLRASWSKTSPRLGVFYSDQKTRLELTVGRHVVCSGIWDAQIELNGEVTRPNVEWEEVCWFSDAEVDYLELQIGLDSEWKLQRKIMLGRTDGVLYLSDAVLGHQSAQIKYQSTLPLASGVKFKAQKDTRDGFLKFNQQAALVLPLSLPEWRSEVRIGELTAVEGGLNLQQTQVGQNLFAALWIDLNARRNTKPCTWRHLTVAQNRQIVARDQAVGFRVQVGNEQWLAYRSFLQPSNRTILGHNLISESLIGRFTKKGEVDSLVEVE